MKIYTLYSVSSIGLGFNITGGVDQPHLPNDTGVFVTKIREQASAAVDGRLKEGDKILEVYFIITCLFFVIFNNMYF